jgi:hypothetical protein
MRESTIRIMALVIILLFILSAAIAAVLALLRR